MNDTRVPVAFIGLGLMGAHMAGRILAAGHPLHVYNRTRAKAEGLMAAARSGTTIPARRQPPLTLSSPWSACRRMWRRSISERTVSSPKRVPVRF